MIPDGVKYDPEDAKLLEGPAWYFNNGYLRREVWSKGKRRREYMHRVIMGAKCGEFVDHINGDRADNRRCNLRIVTNSQNLQNRHGPTRVNRLGKRGVHATPNGTFRAHIGLGGKTIVLGTFKTIEEADRAAKTGRAKYMTHSEECQ